MSPLKLKSLHFHWSFHKRFLQLSKDYNWGKPERAPHKRLELCLAIYYYYMWYIRHPRAAIYIVQQVAIISKRPHEQILRWSTMPCTRAESAICHVLTCIQELFFALSKTEWIFLLAMSSASGVGASLSESAKDKREKVAKKTWERKSPPCFWNGTTTRGKIE